MKETIPTPRGARLALRLLPADQRESILGDLIEESGGPPPLLFFWRQTIAIAAAFFMERLRRPTPSPVPEPRRKGDPLMQSLWQDLRFAARTLMKTPGFTLVAVLTLALGIGANTAMFSVLNTYFFRALPYPESDQIVRVFRTSPQSQNWPHSPGNYYDYQAQNTVFEKIAAYTGASASLAEPGEPAERLQCINITADFFDVLGVQPALGRAFTAEEEVQGADGVVVLTHTFWMRRFNGDPGVVGRTLRLNGSDATVVGVMPPGAEYPLLWGAIDLWKPQSFTAEWKKTRNTNFLSSVARLKPGVSIEQAEDAMVALAANIGRENSTNEGESIRLAPLHKSVTDDIGRNVMWFTFGLAGFVLLIACANLANLQLVRTAARSREYAVRAALGAGRGRMLRQALTESFVVALLGGLLSLVLAQWCVTFLSSRLFSELPGAHVSLDLTVFGFALLVSLLTGLVFGTVPAWLASRADVNQALRQNARGTTAGRSHHYMRNALVVGEVAFALILLTGAGLFLRGLQKFTHLDPGWEVDGLLTARVALQSPEYRDDPQRIVFYQQLEDRLRQLPGVENVALSASRPIFGFQSSTGRVVEGQPEPPPGQWPLFMYEPVSPDYFETYGVRLLEGRAFTAQDTADRPSVTIINETAARTFWPNESPIGKRIGRGTGPDRKWDEIVGVVSDMDFPANLSESDTRFQMFIPVSDSPPFGGIVIALRTSATPEALGNTLRRTVAEIDPGLAVFQVHTARGLVDQGLGSLSLLGTLLGTFAALGLVLAVIGIYGVTSYSVAQRTGEIGIRMAIGAQRRDVLWLVLRAGATQSLIGALIGIGGGYAISRLLEAAIPNLPTRDPVTFVAIALTLIAVTLVACYLPARRATKVDPLDALRHE